MRPTWAMRMYSAQVTLFTKSGCGLCDVAKTRVQELTKKRTVDYHEVDIEAAGNEEWRNAYAWDVPVVHIERVMHMYSKPNIVTQAQKLMHRFTVDEMERLVDNAEQGVA